MSILVVKKIEIVEATEYDCLILSFFKEEYVDCSLNINVDSEEYIVHSIYSPGYLLELYDHELEIDRPTYLKIRYENTRIDCSFMDSDSGLDNLEMDEFDLLIGTLDKFVQHNSWEDIAVDDGLKYKKFHAQTQFFNNYRKQTIMKLGKEYPIFVEHRINYVHIDVMFLVREGL